VALTFARGFTAGTAACGIKAFTAGASAIPTGHRDDLCVVHSSLPCDAGGVFTTNKIKSASVVIDQLHLQHNRIRALAIISGNANACTGAQGFKDALQMAKLTADRLDLDPEQVLVGTTGVIGRYLPMDAIKPGIAEACGKLSPDGGADAARAIMTTDLVPKTAELEIELAGVNVRIGGMCKGSGMIHPNMATMLAYITTDAAVEPGLIRTIVKSIADRSFNQVTIDGDSSTNDTFLVLANGAAGNEPIRSGSPEAEQLETALLQVATGRADATVIENYLLAAFSKTNPGKLKEAAFKKPLNVQYGSWAVQKGNSALVSYLNKYLCKVQGNGQLAAIYKKTEGTAIPPMPKC